MLLDRSCNIPALTLGTPCTIIRFVTYTTSRSNPSCQNEQAPDRVRPARSERVSGLVSLAVGDQRATTQFVAMNNIMYTSKHASSLLDSFKPIRKKRY